MAFPIHVQTPPLPPYRAIRETWLALEAAGVEAIWTWDHFFTEFTPGDYEGWSLLAALAEATSAVKIGVLVTAATFRHPSLLAKICTTVDHISDGRLIIGLGMARLETEHRAFGIPWLTSGQRFRRMRECLDVIDGLATGEPFSYEGRHAVLHEARGHPLNIQRPRPPVLIGAHGPQMTRFAAERAEMWNGFGYPEHHLEHKQRVDAACREVGRDPATLQRLASVYQAEWNREGLAAYRDAGATGAILISGSNDPATLVPAIEKALRERPD